MSTPLFAYGTLRAGERNAGVLDQIPRGSRQPATARGSLVTLGPGDAHAYTYPAITLDAEGPEVPGELFAAPGLDEHWTRLDDFEGCEYRRVLTLVETTEGPVEAWVYERDT